jgi:hypothetical protein
LEFATPIPTKKVQQIEKEGNSSRNELGTSSKKEEKFVSQFNPFGVQDNSKMPANEYFHKLHLKV